MTNPCLGITVGGTSVQGTADAMSSNAKAQNRASNGQVMGADATAKCGSGGQAGAEISDARFDPKVALGSLL